ncbi:MAG: hypothetical protein V5B34_10560 [Accumulibacter sp.]
MTAGQANPLPQDGVGAKAGGPDGRFAVALETVSTDHYAFASLAWSRARAPRVSPFGVQRAEAGFTVSG